MPNFHNFREFSDVAYNEQALNPHVPRKVSDILSYLLENKERNPSGRS